MGWSCCSCDRRTSGRSSGPPSPLPLLLWLEWLWKILERSSLPSFTLPGSSSHSAKRQLLTFSLSHTFLSLLVLLLFKFLIGFLFFSWHGLITISRRSGPMWMRCYFFGFTLKTARKWEQLSITFSFNYCSNIHV